MWLEIVLDTLLQGLMDGAVSERISKRIRIICILLISLFFLTVVALLFLVTFLAGEESLLRRGAFFLLGLGILAYYLQFLKIVMSRRKKGKKP